jgi:hypothetical protein
MPRWFISLEGDAATLDRLLTAFPHPPVQIDAPDGLHRLHDQQFDELEDPQTVRIGYEQIVTLLSALSQILWDAGFGDLQPGSLTSVDDDGKPHAWAFAGVASVAVGAHGVDILGPDGTKTTKPRVTESISRSLQLAREDRNVRDALYFLRGRDPSWSDLYKVFEIVRADVGRKERIVANGWATDRELNRLTGTANHQKLAGVHARHARMSEAPMPDPMSLEEGQDLARRFVRAWIEAKSDPPDQP